MLTDHAAKARVQHASKQAAQGSWTVNWIIEMQQKAPQRLCALRTLLRLQAFKLGNVQPKIEQVAKKDKNGTQICWIYQFQGRFCDWLVIGCYQNSELILRRSLTLQFRRIVLSAGTCSDCLRGLYRAAKWWGPFFEDTLPGATCKAKPKGKNRSSFFILLVEVAPQRTGSTHPTFGKLPAGRPAP